MSLPTEVSLASEFQEHLLEPPTDSHLKSKCRLDAWDKCSGLVHWDDPEGWDGEGGGKGVQDGEHK